MTNKFKINTNILTNSLISLLKFEGVNNLFLSKARFWSYLVKYFLFYCCLITSITTAQAQVTPPIPNDPISVTGHGSIYSRDGTAVDVDLEFISSTLDFYTNLIDVSATPTQKSQQIDLLTTLSEGDWELQASLIARMELLGWYNQGVSSPHKALLSRRLGALYNELTLDLSSDVYQEYDIPSELRSLIDSTIPRSITLAFTTTERDEAYIDECRAAGVPIPPAWGRFGPGEWVQRGILRDADMATGQVAEEFIDRDLEAEVYTYETDAPDGVCIALPRANDVDADGEVQDLDDVIRPLGIICLGRITSNVCFWDATSEGMRFNIAKGEEVELSEFAGGVELDVGFVAPNGMVIKDVCTECHAGENPFTIHPGTALDQPTINYQSAEWYNPIVPESWPQNAGPANNISDIDDIEECTVCHTQTGSGGRLPQISQSIAGYCGTVLNPALELTMPQGAPGTQAGSDHANALRALCLEAPTEILRIEETDINFGEVEIGFSYTKPILIHNDGDASLVVNSVTLTTPGGSPALSQFDITSVNGLALPFTVEPGKEPLQALVTFSPTTDNESEITFSVQTSGTTGALSPQNVTLTGTGKASTPVESVLVLDRSGSMDEDAGDRSKIRAARDAASIYMDLLRPPQGDFIGDSLGFVKYNNNNSAYLPLQTINQTLKDDISADHLSDAALFDSARLEPIGATGIGGAMLSASTMIGAPNSSHQVMIVMTDGEENVSPFIDAALPTIETANNQLQLYSIGLGDDIEPDKLQSITNQGDDGFHQVTGTLAGFSIFDLEAFYFKIFANAAGMELAVDPTFMVDLLQSGTVTVDTATVVTSDHTATFIVLEDPVLRGFYDLQFESPTGQIIQPGSFVGGIPVQISSRHTYTIYKIVFPDISQAGSYVGEWKLQLTPNGQWDKRRVKSAIADSHFDYTNQIQPLSGQVPIGFAAAVGSDYRLDVNVDPATYNVGTKINLFGYLTDRFWPSVDGSVSVEITLPNGTKRSLDLFDNATVNDVMAEDGTWTNRFSETSQAGVYKFYFQSNGRNLRGELAPREETRYITLEDPNNNQEGNCYSDNPCFKVIDHLNELTVKLEEAIQKKDDQQVKFIYEKIRFVFNKYPNCVKGLESLNELYEKLLDSFFNSDSKATAKILKLIYEILERHGSPSDCNQNDGPRVCEVPDLNAPCAKLKIQLNELTTAIETRMANDDEKSVKEIYAKIKFLLDSNPDCAQKLKPVNELYEKMITLFLNKDTKGIKDVLKIIRKQIFIKTIETNCPI